MPAPQSKDFLQPTFQSGWVIQRATDTNTDSCIVLDNFRVEPDGSLRGRQGITVINEEQLTDGSSTRVHSHRLQSNTRYVGVGSLVRRGIDPGVDIITGLTGRRLTFANASPSTATPELWTYFANGDRTVHGAAAGDCRKKDNGFNTYNWGIEGPSGIVTLALSTGQPATTPIDDFSTAYTPAGDGGGTDGADPAPYEGIARAFTVPKGKTERFQRTGLALDLTPPGDTAFIRFMAKAKRIQNLDHVEVAFGLTEITTGGGGGGGGSPATFTIDQFEEFYNTYDPGKVGDVHRIWLESGSLDPQTLATLQGLDTSWMSARSLTDWNAALSNFGGTGGGTGGSSSGFASDYFYYQIPATAFALDNTWQEFKIKKSAFTRIKPTFGSARNWESVSNIQITVAANQADADNTDAAVVSFDDMRTEADTHPDGSFDYRLTWWNNDLKIRSNFRSNGDLYTETDRTSATISAHRQEITVTRPTTLITDDPQVTHWELWRRNYLGSGTFLFVGRIPITTFTYSDILGDLDLGDEMVEDDNIPPTGRYIFYFDDRVFILGMTSQNFIGKPVFTGTGLSDLTLGGSYTGITTKQYILIVDSVGAVDTFKWSDDGGSTFTTGVSMASSQTLSNGVVVTFATTGYTLNDEWNFTAAATGEEESPYSVRYSKRFYPESFPITNYFLAGSPLDTIRGGCVWHERLFIWTHARVYEIIPGPGAPSQDYVVHPTEAAIGTESPYSITPAPEGIYYEAPELGILIFNGYTAEPISYQQLNPFFLREDVTQDGITVFALQGNTESSYEEHAAVYYNGYYWISVQCSDGSCVVLIYNTMLKTWYRAHGTGWDVIRFEWERSGSGTTFADVLEGGTESGWLIRYEPNPTIVGDHYDAETRCVAQTVLEGELKPPDREIDCKGILVDVDAGGQAVMCEVSLNDGPLQLVGTQFVGGAFLDGRSLAYFPINQERTTIAHKLSVRITVNQRTSRVTVFGIGCRYWVEPRADVSYSGQYFFTRAFGWCRRAQITMRSTSAVDLILIADGSEVYRTTLQQTNNERKGITVPFITGVEGKVIEYRMSSDDPFVLYEGSYIEAMELDSDRQMIPWQMVS